MHPEQAVRVGAAQLRHFGSHAFQKVAVVADHQGGECGTAEEILQPLDAGQIQVVGRFVEEQQIGRSDQGLGNGEALLPAPGECRGRVIEVLEARAAQHLGLAAVPFRGGCRGAIQRLPDQRAHRLVRGELALLRNVADPNLFPYRNLTRVRLLAAGQYAEQRALAGAVGPDQPDPVSFGYRQRQIAKERSPVRFRQALCIEQQRHSTSLSRRGGRQVRRAVAGRAEPPLEVPVSGAVV